MDILSLSAGGFIGFFASIAKDWLMENKKQKLKKEEFQREKLEEIYLIFEKWVTSFSKTYLLYLACYYNHIDYENVLEEITKESKLLSTGEFQKLQMLINIHFPKLVKEYTFVEQARDRISPFLTNPQNNKLSAKDFELAQKNFESVCNEFKSHIITLAKKINP